jgi:hypothetical protein
VAISLPANDPCSKVAVDDYNAWVLTFSGLLVRRIALGGATVTHTPPAGERGTAFAVNNGGGILITRNNIGATNAYAFGKNNEGTLMIDTSADVTPGVLTRATLLQSWADSLTSQVVDLRSYAGTYYARLANGQLYGWAPRILAAVLCQESKGLDIYDTQRAFSSVLQNREAVKIEDGYDGSAATSRTYGALMDDGSVMIWGDYGNDKGYIPSRYRPTAGVTFTDIKVGDGFVLLLSQSGNVYTTGINPFVKAIFFRLGNYISDCCCSQIGRTRPHSAFFIHIYHHWTGLWSFWNH